VREEVIPMGAHIAVVGNGRIGRPTAYTLFNERLADEFSLADTKPEQAWAFGEELKHVAASLKYDIKINTYEEDEGVEGADLVVVCPGKPRIPGVQMDRRELVGANAEIVNHIAEVMPGNNPHARWVIVTNPVDAMATLFKKVSGADFVIGTGDHPDTLRMRTKISIELGIPVSTVEGFVGGEHGSAAHPLWSTIKVESMPLAEYLSESGKELDREAVTGYVRGVSKKVLDIIGGTEVGPAAGFRDIVRSILEDRCEIYSVSQTLEFQGIPEPVNVNVPTRIGKEIGPNIWNELAEEDRANIAEAAKAIYANYQVGMKAVGKA
jgi:malate dehydrogenase